MQLWPFERKHGSLQHEGKDGGERRDQDDPCTIAADERDPHEHEDERVKDQLEQGRAGALLGTVNGGNLGVESPAERVLKLSKLIIRHGADRRKAQTSPLIVNPEPFLKRGERDQTVRLPGVDVETFSTLILEGRGLLIS